MTSLRTREWFDDDSLWQDLYPYMYPDEQFAAATQEVEKALELTRPVRGRALDLCCGPGRCSIPLAQAGFRVTGVDRTACLLEKARNKAAAAGADIEWVQADMRDFLRANFYDLALVMFSSFGFFDDKREDVQVLRNIYKSLKAGGAFLIDVMGKECLARAFQPTTSTIVDGGYLIRRQEVLEDWTRIRNEWFLVQEDRAKAFRFQQTIYSGQELRDRMEQAGFVGIRLFGNLEGDDYGRAATRLVAVGLKPREEAQDDAPSRHQQGCLH